MTPLQIEQTRALEKHAFDLPIEERRFIWDMVKRATPRGKITSEQAKYLDGLAHRYRERLGECMAEKPCAACAKGKKKPSAAPAVEVDTHGRWTCPEGGCGAVNHDHATKCRRCGFVRVAPSAAAKKG